MVLFVRARELVRAGDIKAAIAAVDLALGIFSEDNTVLKYRAKLSALLQQRRD